MTDLKPLPSVLQVGCGSWGRNLARNFAQLGALVGVSDSNVETAAREAALNDVAALSFAEAMSDRNIDAVSIATPAILHAELALRAFEAGKHVFVEKPLALSMEEAQRVCAAAAAADRILMVGHLLQYHPAFEALLASVRGEQIGKLRYAYSNRLSLGKFRTEENVLWSFAVHDVSMLLSVFGEAPQTVAAQGGAYVTPHVEDEYRVDMTFSGGRRAHVFTSWLHPFKEHRLVVVGETGIIVFEDSAPASRDKLRLYRYRIELEAGAVGVSRGDPEPLPFSPDEPLRRECLHFLQCCQTGARPRTDGVEALQVLSTLLRASEA